MVHPRDFKGKHFNHQLDPGGTVQPTTVLDRGIKTQATRHITTHLRTGAGSPGGQMWNFKFLKYWSGAITRTQLNQPVLTGPMSGCILCRYVKNGTPYIAHIGTADTPTDPRTIAVKNAWTAYQTAGGVSNVVGRKPTHVIQDIDIIPLVTGPKIPQVWGYFTQTDAWALLIEETNVGGQISNKILLSRPMQLVPWASIQGSW